MSLTHEWGICYQVWCVYEIGMRVPFSKQYRYVTNHLHLYIADYCIFLFTITLSLLTVNLSLGNANICSNTTFTTIVICHQISTGPMDLCLAHCSINYCRPQFLVGESSNFAHICTHVMCLHVYLLGIAFVSLHLVAIFIFKLNSCWASYYYTSVCVHVCKPVIC